jgi:hypothetical protein
MPAPKIDGFIQPEEWQPAFPTRLNFQIQPGNNSPPTQATQVWIGYDHGFLYIAIDARDESRAAVRGRVRPRDDLEDDDAILLYLDTFNDRRRAYLFVVNPVGVQADGIFTEGTEEDFTWDGIFTSAGRITDSGYQIEIAIPFQTLRFRRQPVLDWNIHVQRRIARRAELISLAPLARDVNGFLLQAAKLEGLENVRTNPVVDIIPSLVGQWDRARLDPGSPLNTAWRGDPGLTINYSLTPNLTLSTAVNPDFSQVEADVPLIDVNQRFPLFFPERRPFFLEGGEVFRPLQISPASLNLVNTRSIIDPDWGLKLTGKVGRFNVGYLTAADRAPRRAALPGTLESRENALVQVARFQRDFGRDSAFGGLFTDRRHAGTANTVAAADYRLRLARNTTFFGQNVVSRTQPLASARYGQAHVARFLVEDKHWTIVQSLRHVSAQFESQVGFLPRNGVSSSFTAVSYRIRPQADSWFIEMAPGLEMQVLRTAQGRIDESFFGPGFFIELANAISAGVFYAGNLEFVGGRYLRYRFFGAEYAMNKWKRVGVTGELALGEAGYYGATPQVGRDAIQSTLTLTLRPGNRLTVEVRHLHTSLNARDGRELVRQDIVRERTVFQFNRFFSFRSITEYNSARRRLAVSQLFTYLPRPNTAVFIGYNDLFSNPVVFGRRNHEEWQEGLMRMRQTFFVKLTYNFRR